MHQNIPRELHRLKNYNNPGLDDLLHEPKVHTTALAASEMKLVCSALEALLPKNVDPQKNRSYSSQLIDKGYHKICLDEKFISSYLSFLELPPGIRIRVEAKKTAIAFISEGETLSDTHHDQDPSFLLVLKGEKQFMYAPPTAGKLFANRVVETHSSIYDGVNPFKDQDQHLIWKLARLSAGDGLLVPKRWLHAVKSSADMCAISFQVVATGSKELAPKATQRSARVLPGLATKKRKIQQSSTPSGKQFH